jgi:hypothetical protein
MAQYVMVVTVGNSDSDMDADIETICRGLNGLDVMYESGDPVVTFWCGGGQDGDWPVTFRPLSEVIAS